MPPPRGKTKRLTNTKLGRKGSWDTSTPWTNFKVKGSEVKVTAANCVVVVCLFVRLSVPCLHLEGKRKGLRIRNSVGRVPGRPAPRGPISRSRGQRSRSRRLIVLLAKNPHNFAACCPLNLIFGRWRKDSLLPCTDLESSKTACTYSTQGRPHSGRPLNGRTLLFIHSLVSQLQHYNINIVT